MPRAKKQTDEADTSFNPSEFDPTMQPEAVAVISQVAAATEMPPANGYASQHTPAGNGRAAGIEKRKPTTPKDPFGMEGVKAGDNRLHLSQSKADRAWIIRFEQNPNQGDFSKEHPNPVLAYLKSEGYRWGFSDADGQGGWGKLMEEGHYTYSEHLDAQRVLQKAAEMMGASKDQGRITD